MKAGKLAKILDSINPDTEVYVACNLVDTKKDLVIGSVIVNSSIKRRDIVVISVTEGGDKNEAYF